MPSALLSSTESQYVFLTSIPRVIRPCCSLRKGAIGSLAIGIAAEVAVNPGGFDGAIAGNPKLIGVQVYFPPFLFFWYVSFLRPFLRHVSSRSACTEPICLPFLFPDHPC